MLNPDVIERNGLLYYLFQNVRPYRSDLFRNGGSVRIKHVEEQPFDILTTPGGVHELVGFYDVD
jgi:hypothetical protein